MRGRSRKGGKGRQNVGFKYFFWLRVIETDTLLAKYSRNLKVSHLLLEKLKSESHQLQQCFFCYQLGSLLGLVKQSDIAHPLLNHLFFFFFNLFPPTPGQRFLLKFSTALYPGPSFATTVRLLPLYRSPSAFAVFRLNHLINSKFHILPLSKNPWYLLKLCTS